VLRVMMAGTMLLAAGYGIGRGGGNAPVTMSEDEQGIRQAVQYYFDGGRNADSATMGKGFEQTVAHMIYVRDNKLNDVPIPDFLARIHNQRTPEFKPDSNQRRVVSVDFAGTSGIAKLETITPQFVVVDYMSLVKVDGRWKIVNKIFDRVPR
jgi:hypothetical protein